MASEWRGSLTQIRWENVVIFCVILVVYLGHIGYFRPVPVLCFLHPSFSREVLSSKVEEPQKKTMVGAPLS